MAKAKKVTVTRAQKAAAKSLVQRSAASGRFVSSSVKKVASAAPKGATLSAKK